MPFIFHADVGAGVNPYRVIPSPFVQISKDFQTTDDGKIVGTLFMLSIKGKLAADKGSPDSTGTLWLTTGYPPDETVASDARLASIFRKQEALRKLFSTQNDGRKLEFTPWDGTGSIICNPRIKRLEFAEGNWFNTCDYSLQLEADTLYMNGVTTPSGEDIGDPYGFKVSKATEEWNIESGDDRARTFRLTRSVSAQGKRFYGPNGALVKEAWENAREYVLDKIILGLKPQRMEAPDVLDATTLQAYNYMRSQHVNELGGSFQVQETWLCFDPGSGAPAMDDFTVNIRTGENGLSHVSCEGTITGFQVRNNTTFAVVSDRYDNAVDKWDEIEPLIFNRCENISQLTLNPIPLSVVNGHNQNNGVITYTKEYDNRVVPITADAVSELITLQKHNQGDVFASIPVLGRALGPVLQDIGTKTAKRLTVQMEIVMPATRINHTQSAPNTDALLLSLLPIGSSQIFKENDEETWVARTGRYSRSASFTWE